MALEEAECLGFELVVPVGEEGGAGEARGVQVSEDVLGPPGAGDGEAVLGYVAER
ncbi:hypothetical protein ABZ078_30355 [Streptomyces sp. NPDC006385]|uniref:hypothetical protein n=1 Tax=Streptomyces sp. NPDC006385 TaxID=3156761 RepID=UPI0033A85128